MSNSSLKKTASLREVILAVVATIALFGIFVNMVYNPQSKKIDELKEKEKASLSEKKALESQINVLVEQRQKKQQIEAPTQGASDNIRINILNGVLKPELTDITNVLRALSEPEFGHDITISSVSYKPISKEAGYSKIPLLIAAHGNFKKIVSFLKNLDEFPVLFSVDSVNISADSVVKGEMNIEAEATLYQVEGIVSSSASEDQP